MERTVHKLKKGVDLYFISDKKFKTYMASVLFRRPLKREEATLASLLSQVLRCSNSIYKTSKEISSALEELFGASLYSGVGKRGEEEILRVAVEGVSDEFLPSPAFGKTVELLFATAFNGGSEKYVEQEKKNLADRIRGQINDKRYYAIKRLNEIMFAEEAYGVNTLGYEEDLKNITSGELFDFYSLLKNTSNISIVFTGNFDEAAALKAAEKAAEALPEREVLKTETVIKSAVEKVKKVTDRMDVTQGKLSIGMRTGIAGSDPLVFAQMVFSGIYGAGPSSKLFMNVRERLSLCYYASSWADRMKGWLRVTSGIEFENFQKAYDEIIAQLELMKKGEFSDKDTDVVKKELINQFRSAADGVESLEDYYTTQLCLGTDMSIDETAKAIEEVSREDIIKVAENVKLDTVYFLTGKEEA